MRHILVPFDGSDCAMRAVRHAASLARDNPAWHIELLHVHEPVALGLHAALDADQIGRMQADESARVLQPAQALLDQSGVQYKVCSRTGDPAAAITDHAQENYCEAIIMGTRGMGTLASMVMGSVATRVVHLATVPVTLIK